MPYSQLKADARQSPSAPKVHRGFFASWHCNDLDRRVIAHVRHILDRRKNQNYSGMRVIVTGAACL